MARYWTSWWTDQAADGVPWACWITGERAAVPHESVCAVIDADSEELAWQRVGEFFADNERRFISARADNWRPASDRFP